MRRFTVVATIGVFILPMPSFAQTKPTRPSKVRKDSQLPVLSPQSFNSAEPRTLNGGETHTYPLKLKANDYVKLVVEQRGIDVVVRLVGPDGTPVQEQDSSAAQGPELIPFIAEKGGTYQLEVEALEKDVPPGKYELKLEAHRKATKQDRAEVELENLNEEVSTLEDEGKYDEALPLAQQAVAKTEQILGVDSLVLATSLNTLANLHHSKGDYDQAESHYRRALAIREKVLGPDHLETATILNNLGVLYKHTGEYLKAEPLYQRALAIYEKTVGPDDLETANSLNNLANFYSDKGDYAQAEPLYQRSLSIIEKVLGPDDPGVALNLNNLAQFYWATGDYARAEQFFQRSLTIWEKALGADHPNVATSLNNLASLYSDKGDYPKAEPLYQRSLAIREKALGPDHPETATSLNNLAGFYCDKGDYPKAEPLYQRSLAIREKVLGPDHPDTADSLNNLANLYADKGDLAKAEPLYQRSLAIYEKSLGSDHPLVATSLSNLANLYQAKGDLAKAEPLFQRSLAINEAVLGLDHPETATTLSNLAHLYQDKGDLAKAEPLYQRALSIREKALGPDHPSVATSLNKLASLYCDKGDYPRAEPLFRRSLAIRERVLGPDHPLVGDSLNNLAGLYQAKGETTQAIVFLTRSNDTTERDLIRNLVSGSENQKALYLNQTSTQTDQTISLQVQGAPRDQAALQAALTVILRRKGRSLDAMTSAIAILRNQSNPETRKLLDAYTRLVNQISILTLNGPGKKKPETHLADLRELEDQKEKLEAEISTRSAEFKTQVTPITLEAVKKLIPASATLLEYAVYHLYDAKTHRLGRPRYVVYLLDQREELRFADLGEAEPIQQAVAAFRRAVSNQASSDGWSRKLSLSIQATGDSSAQANVKLAGHQLEKLIFEPVKKMLGTAQHLLISPDGDLNLIPFAALTDETGKYLAETYRLTYLTSGRDLLRLQVKTSSQEPPLILVNPIYGDGKGPVLFGNSFAPLSQLKGTIEEGTFLKQLFPDAILRLEAQATKKTLQSVTRPAMVHIATHGYFLKDIPHDDTPATNQEQRLLTREDNAQAVDTETLRQANPLLRSWLFFAGANNSETTGENDGIMTALEAAQLNLWGTKLVVLSACDTGLGDVKNGEGVYGLRRAFVLAGSEAQMMSLWSVSDAGTRELMVEYYTRLKKGEGRSEALRNTQLKMLKDPKRRHPFYWAAFIQSGAWTNLEGK
ncbi:MAG TPA: tetratricopeptide repeat protein [Acidobacteriota bacterium]|nr:tetratricopeptide repeat protein [Acidobacteriota bacterium]